MLPQFQALEDSPAGMPGQARNGADPNAGGQDVPGETGFGRRHGRGPVDSRCGVSRVFALDRRGEPLMPCHPARARSLAKKGRAVVVRLHPFTMPLRDRTGGETRALDPGIDPGSRRTGLALVRDDGAVLSLAEIGHRGGKVRKSMRQRAVCRRRRRPAKLRHRKRRILKRRSGRRLPPSLQSRVDNVLAWTERLRGLARVSRSRIPVGCLIADKPVRGFRTGDVVRATVPSGKRQGVHVGRVAVRVSGSFDVQAAGGTFQGVSHLHCRSIVQRGDRCGCHLDTSPRQGEPAALHGTLDPARLPNLKAGVS